MSDATTKAGLESIAAIALKDSPQAAYELGQSYRLGEGVEVNVPEAIACYKLAAENGHVVSMMVLGALFQLGTGIPRDLKQAYHWYSLAKEHGQQHVDDLLVEVARQMKTSRLTK
jgi:hypothetical protein